MHCGSVHSRLTDCQHIAIITQSNIVLRLTTSCPTLFLFPLSPHWFLFTYTSPSCSSLTGPIRLTVEPVGKLALVRRTDVPPCCSLYLHSLILTVMTAPGVLFSVKQLPGSRKHSTAVFDGISSVLHMCALAESDILHVRSIFTMLECKVYSWVFTVGIC